MFFDCFQSFRLFSRCTNYYILNIINQDYFLHVNFCGLIKNSVVAAVNLYILSQKNIKPWGKEFHQRSHDNQGFCYIIYLSIHLFIFFFLQFILAVLGNPSPRVNARCLLSTLAYALWFFNLALTSLCFKLSSYESV